MKEMKRSCKSKLLAVKIILWVLLTPQHFIDTHTCYLYVPLSQAVFTWSDLLFKQWLKGNTR